MPKLIKDCKSRQKNGRCKRLGQYCGFLISSPLQICSEAGGSEKPKKGRGKK